MFSLRATKKFHRQPCFIGTLNPKYFSNEKVKKAKESENKYSRTCRLPTTTFDQRANSAKREPEIQEWWNKHKIYDKLKSTNTKDCFYLHDGPPYANGDLHIGHALNKILKDFINKYQTLRGKKVSYIPGWDCHGLPIEMKVLQSLKQSEKESLTPLALRKRASEFAIETMKSQSKSFQRYGIWGDWSQPYLTLQPEYEATQIRVFGEMVLKGHIYRGKKPVHWSPSSRTALAEAELEYPDNHTSRSIYLGFRATEFSPALQHALEKSNNNSLSDVRVCIWTTTPWTIPSNLAVAVNEDIQYALVSHPSINQNQTKYLVAKDLINVFTSKVLGIDSEVQGCMEVEALLSGRDLIGTQYQHPLCPRVSPIVSGGHYITTESGTGLVHIAPGHGQEDYQVGQRLGLPLLSPVDDLGRFTEEAGKDLVGLAVLTEGTAAVIDQLKPTGSFLKEESYPHKYPYDWRTKKPTIFRATEQWFASVSSFRKEAIEGIDSVQWIPSVGRNRISSMVQGRGDWCISRQRTWGVPIPVFYHKQTGEPLMTPETLKHIEELFREKGSNIWWEVEDKEEDISILLPPSLRHLSSEYHKGTDTMDVWFDSGTSWAGVMQEREKAFPADLYLEGSDQHRGWFQSSLLTAVACTGQAPYKSVLTHGFVLDEKGMKMSKSLGNVIDPRVIIEGGSNQKEKPALGADTLRLWVSSVDFSTDVCIGEYIMKRTSESYRKIRNTLRFLVGSLNDFDPKIHSVSYDSLPSLDKHVLGRLTEILGGVQHAYDTYSFSQAHQMIFHFLTQDLSSFYLDLSKDRLYISSQDDPRRRSCQTVMHTLLEQLSIMLAPILPHLSEELWGHLPYPKTTLSIFQQDWPESPDRLYPSHENQYWGVVSALRRDVLKCIENARKAKLIGSATECQVTIHFSSPSSPSSPSSLSSTLQTENNNKLEIKEEFLQRLQGMAGDSQFLSPSISTNAVDDLRFIFIVSRVNFASTAEEVVSRNPEFNLSSSETETGFTIGVKRAEGKRCERCWNFCESVGANSNSSNTFHSAGDLCLRCAEVIRLDFSEFKNEN